MNGDARSRARASARFSHRGRLRLLRVAAVFGALAVVAFLALRHSPFVDTLPWMPHWLGGWADQHGVSRNIVAFFALGLGCATLLGARTGLFVFLAAFGTAIEVAQIWIPGRTFDLRDIAATLAGLALAWIAAWSARRAITPREARVRP